MAALKQDILAKLRKEILPLQGYAPLKTNQKLEVGWGAIDEAFPNHQFPLAATHEFICNDHQQVAATTGFLAVILQSLMTNQGVCVWITHQTNIFPHGLTAFGIRPEQIIFVDISNQKNILWAVEEALHCEGLSAVIAEVPRLDFKASRRLQLAVEKSKVTGFIIRPASKNITTTACISRWSITSLPSDLPGELPGVGFPAWKVELLKVRNGRPGVWQLQWSNNRFQHIGGSSQKDPAILRVVHLKQKTG